MFDAIASRYDMLNRILSFGLDSAWRRRAVKALKLKPGHRVLDIATGTGDTAFRIMREENDLRVYGLDPSLNMMKIARRKAESKSLIQNLELLRGSAEQLPFDDNSFDAATITFGIRNVPDRALALSEMARVVTSRGRIGILELSEPRNSTLGRLAHLHIHRLVPRVGALISGKREYHYLQQSIAAFPSADVFVGLMEQAGIEVLQVLPFTFGVCNLFVGQPKP